MEEGRRGAAILAELPRCPGSTTLTPFVARSPDASPAALSGVFPVVATPFDSHGAPDAASLERLVDYLLCCGVDGMTFRGVASEVGTLAPGERRALTEQLCRLSAGIAAFVNAPETQAKLRERGVVPVGSTAQDFAKAMNDEFELYKKVVADAHIKAD
jgi:hypothetical protein